MTPPVSVLIPTRNEAAVIERAIRSVSWADEVVIINSGSTDDTVARATALGARVHVQPWLGWIGQKVRGVRLCTHDWILWIDADEIVTPELATSIRNAMTANPDPLDGYVLERAEEFLGVLMPNMRRRSKRQSFVRLFNKRHSTWDPQRIVHETVVCPGRLHSLGGLLLHWRNYTIGRQLTTLNANADLEAEMIVAATPRGIVPLLIFKPPARFLWLYLKCGNWRYGTRGFIWSMLHSFDEFLRYAKAWEQLNISPRPNPPAAVETAKNTPSALYDRGEFVGDE